MGNQPLLEVNCSNCPGNQACEDCLVRFFLAERDATVVSIARRGAGRRVAPTVPSANGPRAGSGAQPGTAAAAVGVPAALPPDLATAFALLDAAGLEPELLSVEPAGTARAS